MQQARCSTPDRRAEPRPVDGTSPRGSVGDCGAGIATANLRPKPRGAKSRDRLNEADVVVSRRRSSPSSGRTVCGVPTNQLEAHLLSIAKEMPNAGIPAWLQQDARAGTSGRRWPKDEEFQQSLLRYRAYAQPIDRCKFCS